jgi:L-2-hydroxyglutarate oxidase LhgO
MDRVEAVVVGAGVVGLAVARALAMRGIETLVLERENAIGTGISSRNSEVIHAGLYYPTGSLKARLCVQGKTQLYAFCESHAVEHRRCGKLLVATDAAQLPALAALRDKAAANGVHDLVRLSPTEAIAMEPQLHCVGALWSPSTGILDSHGFMLALQGDLERHGGIVAVASPVTSIRLGTASHSLEVGGQQPMRLETRYLINCAGLWAPTLAAGMQGLPPGQVPTAYFCKGNYYSLRGRAPFTRLVYPMPQQAGLGLHFTLDLGGRGRFGPDVQWLDARDEGAIDHRVDVTLTTTFQAEVRRYWPALPDGSLQPDYSGVRPKLAGPLAPQADFMAHGPEAHGIPGLVNLFGIESPGLTASLSLAELVARRL